jgi:hypothetical protein
MLRRLLVSFADPRSTLQIELLLSSQRGLRIETIDHQGP